jgi:enoyl-CoA hydratase
VANEFLNVEVDEGIALLTLDRPEVHNALNGELLRSLADAIAQLGVSPEVRAIILTGAGQRAFSAGADLDEISGLDAPAAHEALSAGQRIMSAIEASPVPVIAAVNGLALGGGFELILSCTFPVLSDNAALGLPESGLGLIPGYGGTQRLTQRVGKSVAAHLMLTGTRLDARRAYQLGLTPLEPVEPGQLLSTAKQVAAQMAGKGPLANAAILQALQVQAPTREQLALETGLAAIAVAGAESTEGIAAFKERRPAQFTSTGKTKVAVQ